MDRSDVAVSPRRFECLKGGAKPEQEVELPSRLDFTAADSLAFLALSEEIRRASVKPGLSPAGRVALRFLSQQARRLARARGRSLI